MNDHTMLRSEEVAPTTPTARRFEGRTALVTGAGSGIGRAIAERLAREHAAVAVVDVNADASAAVAAELSKEGSKALGVMADVSDPHAVAPLFDEVDREFGPPDLLFNVAGIFVPGTSLEDFNRTFAVNVRGTWLTSMTFIRRARAREGGTAIVNTGSAEALAPEPEAPAYSASKGAISSLTRALALDHGSSGVRVNCVAPGHILTPMTEETFTDEALAWISVEHPVGRVGKPEDVAAAALFLASDDAQFITGEELTVDGGFYAGRDIFVRFPPRTAAP